VTPTANGTGKTELTVGELAERYAQILSGRAPIASLGGQERNDLHALISTADRLRARHANFASQFHEGREDQSLSGQLAERWLTSDLVGGFEPLMMTDWVPGTAFSENVGAGYARHAFESNLDVLQLQAAATAPLDDHYAESHLVRRAVRQQAVQQSPRSLAQIFAPNTSPEESQALLESLWADPSHTSADTGPRDSGISRIQPYPRAMNRAGSRMIPGTLARAAQMWTATGAPEMLRLMSPSGADDEAMTGIGSESSTGTHARRAPGPMTLQTIARAIAQTRAHTGATTTQMITPPVGPMGYAGGGTRDSLLETLATMGPRDRPDTAHPGATTLGASLDLQNMASGIPAIFEAITGSSPALDPASGFSGYDALEAAWVSLQPTRMRDEAILGTRHNATPLAGSPAVPTAHRPLSPTLSGDPLLGKTVPGGGSRWVTPQPISLTTLAHAARMGVSLGGAGDDTAMGPLSPIGAHPSSILAALASPLVAAPSSGESSGLSMARQVMQLPLAHIHGTPGASAWSGEAHSSTPWNPAIPESASPISAFTDGLLIRHLQQGAALFQSPAAMATALNAPASMAEALVSLHQSRLPTGGAQALTPFSPPGLTPHTMPASQTLQTQMGGPFVPASHALGQVPSNRAAAPAAMPWALAPNRAAWTHVQRGGIAPRAAMPPIGLTARHDTTAEGIIPSPMHIGQGGRRVSSSPISNVMEAAPGVFITQTTGRPGRAIPGSAEYAAAPGEGWSPRGSHQSMQIAAQVLQQLDLAQSPSAPIPEGIVGAWDAASMDPTLVQIAQSASGAGALATPSSATAMRAAAPFSAAAMTFSGSGSDRVMPPALRWSLIHQHADRMATAQPIRSMSSSQGIGSAQAPRMARAAQSSLDFSLPHIASLSRSAPAWLDNMADSGPLADMPVAGDVPTFLALAAQTTATSPSDRTRGGILTARPMGAGIPALSGQDRRGDNAGALPHIGLHETLQALISQQRGGRTPSSMLSSGGSRFSSEMLVRIARGVDALGHVPGDRPSPTSRAERALDSEMLATVDKTLITPARQAGSTHPGSAQLAAITKTAMRSARSTAPSHPLIAPVGQAIAAQAHLSREDEAPKAAEAAQASQAGEKQASPQAAPIDLDALAMELAGKISARMNRDVERRGKW